MFRQIRFCAKRKGGLLLEFSIFLGLSAFLLAALFPSVFGFFRALSSIEARLHLTEESLFAEEYIADKVRHTLERTDVTGTQYWDTYPIYAINERNKKAEYRLKVENEKWYFQLWNKKSQPITGDQLEHALFYIGEQSEYFTVELGGLARFSFTLKERGGGSRERRIETAVLPLYDYFLVGEAQEGSDD